MAKHRVPRTGRAMLAFFGELIAKKELHWRMAGRDGGMLISLYRTEAPGYVLAIHFAQGDATHNWAAHTPRRLEVAELFERYLEEHPADEALLPAYRQAAQDIMQQAPELDEMIHWSSAVGGE